MANWVMNTEKIGSDIIVRIGALQVANIHLMKAVSEKGWKAHVRFFDGSPSGETLESVSEALKLIHKHLNSPPAEKH